MAMQSDGVAPEAAKAAYEPPEFVEYGQASSLIETNSVNTGVSDGGTSPDDYAS